jgi:O-antigen/teichoic acid export membrane protein
MTTDSPAATLARTARSLFFAATSAGSAVLLLVLLIVAGRVLGDEQYGRFAFALALATILETLVDFGLKEVATRSVARDHGVAPRLVRHTFGLKLLLGAGTFVLLIAMATYLRDEPEVRLACYLLGAAAVLRSYLMTLRHTLNGLERFDLESLVVVADRGFLLAFGVAALWTGGGLIGLTAAFVASRVAALGLAYAVTCGQVGPIGVGFDVAYWRDLQRAALPFGLFVAVLSLYSYIDTLLLGILRTDRETGFYSAAYRIYEGFTNGAVIIATVAGPKLARHFVTDRARHATLARWAVIAAAAAAVPFVALGLLFARDLLVLLFGEAFAPGASVLFILTAGLLFVFPLQIMHTVAISVNEERLLVKAAAVGLATNVIVNLILIPRLGIEGAAIATLTSEGTSLAFLLGGVLLRLRRERVA